MICSCCGGHLNHDQNVSKGIEPYPHDLGYGLHKECAEWQLRVFFDARIELMRDALSPKNRERFDEMTRAEQEGVVIHMIEQGLLT